MIKIKTVDLKLLRNDEHFQLNTEFKTLVEKHNPEIFKIKSLFEVDTDTSFSHSLMCE